MLQKTEADVDGVVVLVSVDNVTVDGNDVLDDLSDAADFVLLTLVVVVWVFFDGNFLTKISHSKTH